MLAISAIVGSRLDPETAHQLHHMEHEGKVEFVRLATPDVVRKRLRVTTDRGTDCMIAIPRRETLFDGAVLLLQPDRAIVLKVAEERWLRLRPASAADALALGYAAGNLHWRVRFEGDVLEIAIEGPRDAYLARIPELLEAGRVSVLPDSPE